MAKFFEILMSSKKIQNISCEPLSASCLIPYVRELLSYLGGPSSLFHTKMNGNEVGMN